MMIRRRTKARAGSNKHRTGSRLVIGTLVLSLHLLRFKLNTVVRLESGRVRVKVRVRVRVRVALQVKYGGTFRVG